MKFQLVDDWKRFWTWVSMWLIAMNGTFIVAYEQFETVKAFVPDRWAHWIVLGLLALTGVGRILKQAKATDVRPNS